MPTKKIVKKTVKKTAKPIAKPVKKTIKKTVSNKETPKVDLKKLASMGTKIMTEAKKIYAASGKKKVWQLCVKEAAKKLKR